MPVPFARAGTRFPDATEVLPDVDGTVALTRAGTGPMSLNSRKRFPFEEDGTGACRCRSCSGAERIGPRFHEEAAEAAYQNHQEDQEGQERGQERGGGYGCSSHRTV